jgi:F0F1-type ATP synthase alpha subunit
MSQTQLSTDSTEVFHQEAFVSYGKVLTCKDGIIEIAGLRDVMAGELVKSSIAHNGMILTVKNNRVISLGDDTANRQVSLVVVVKDTQTYLKIFCVVFNFIESFSRGCQLPYVIYLSAFPRTVREEVLI